MRPLTILFKDDSLKHSRNKRATGEDNCNPTWDQENVQEEDCPKYSDGLTAIILMLISMDLLLEGPRKRIFELGHMSLSFKHGSPGRHWLYPRVGNICELQMKIMNAENLKEKGKYIWEGNCQQVVSI